MGDYRTTKGQPPPLTLRQRRQRRKRFMLFGLLALLVVLGAGFVFKVDRYILAKGYVTTENYAEVRPASTGTVAEILAQSGQTVQKGQVLVRLDTAEEMATLEESRSQAHKIEAELRRREAEIAERKRKIREDISIARLRLKNASAKLLRTRELLAKGLVAGSALEDTKLREDVARAELTGLLSQDQTIYDKELDVLRQELSARNDKVRRAEARVRSKEIRAPIAGQVQRYEFVIGELVRPESVMYEIFGGSKQVLKLRISERYATRVAPDQPYRARVASYRGLQSVWFTGRLESLRNIIQSEEKTTYRVAYCTFDAQGLTVPPGTTAEARVYYGRSSLWLYLLGLN